MNKEIFKNKIVEIENNICEVEGLPKGEYDAQAVKYDKLVSNSLYNLMMWGNSPQNYTDFCKQGLQNSTGGVVADIGCGTLSFTHREYAEYKGNDLFLCDLSYEMLKIGENRIQGINSDTSKIKFLRSNALDMPFNDNTVDTVLNFGLFHIFDDPSSLLREIVRILKPNGKIFLTSLCSDRKISAKYLSFLHKKGHVSKPLKSIEIKRIIEENGIELIDFRTKGGMTYVTGSKIPTLNKNV